MKKSSFWMSRHRLAQTAAAAALALVFTACKKDADSNNHLPQEKNAIELSGAGLPAQTVEELKAARAATEKYRAIDQAVADGYTDISVVVENMGIHYMKASLADSIFDPRKPEILVYNKQHDGKVELVAVEYAVPIPLTPNAAPQGFTGNADVWTYSTVFNLWLLHAWVWEYNPDGIFNPTNPRVHLHQ